MNGRCEGCRGSLEGDWVACPHCGRPVSGQVSNDRLIQVISKVCAGLVEAGLLEAEARAEKSGRHTQAAQIAVARDLAKEVAPLLADAVTTYAYQKRVLTQESVKKGIERIDSTASERPALTER